MSAGDFTGSLQVLEKRRKDSIFVLGTGRFAQPDTIISAPLNPQSFNRYSYVSNNPANLVDPSGHVAESGWTCKSDTAEKLKKFGIDVVGSCSEWEEGTIKALLEAARLIAQRFVETLKGWDGDIENLDEGYVFKRIFRSVEVGYCGEGTTICNYRDNDTGEYRPVTAGMITYGSHRIGITRDVDDNPFLNVVTNFIHEFGHVFNNMMGGIPTAQLGIWQANHPGYVRVAGDKWRENDYGFYSGSITYSVAVYDIGNPSEEFADMFVGWVLGLWSDSDPGISRRQFMEKNMVIWLIAAYGVPGIRKD